MSEEAVAAMGVSIVPINIPMCPSPNDLSYYQTDAMTPNKKKLSKRDSLTRINPSGKKEESFFELVYEIVRQVPKGRVTTYGAIATCLGTKLSARMVGWAMNGAHTLAKVPAHRVVNRNGMLSGKHHFATPTRMEELLKKEGVIVKDDVIVDFKKIFWDPSNET